MAVTKPNSSHCFYHSVTEVPIQRFLVLYVTKGPTLKSCNCQYTYIGSKTKSEYLKLHKSKDNQTFYLFGINPFCTKQQCITQFQQSFIEDNKLVMFTVLYETSQYHTGKVLSVQGWTREDSLNNKPFCILHSLSFNNPKNPAKGQISVNIIIQNNLTYKAKI